MVYRVDKRYGQSSPGIHVRPRRQRSHFRNPTFSLRRAFGTSHGSPYRLASRPGDKRASADEQGPLSRCPILFGLSVLLPITIGEVAAQKLIPMQYLLFTPFSREALSSCRDRVNIALTILCALFCFFVPVAPPVIMGFLALAVSIQPIFEARRRRQSPQDNRRPSISQRICSDSRPGSRIQPASFALIAALLSCASQSVAFLSFGDGTASINWNSSVEAPFTTVLIAAIPVAALLRSRPNGTIISLSLILATVLSVLEGPVGTHALLFCLLSLSIASAVELRYWRQSHPGHLAIVCALASCACLLLKPSTPALPIGQSTLRYSSSLPAISTLRLSWPTLSTWGKMSYSMPCICAPDSKSPLPRTGPIIQRTMPLQTTSHRFASPSASKTCSSTI